MSSPDRHSVDEVPDVADLSDQLLAQPSAAQDVLERILTALERIEAKLDGTWREGPNPL